MKHERKPVKHKGIVADHLFRLPADIWFMKWAAKWLFFIAFLLFFILAVNWAMRQSVFDLRSVVIQNTLNRVNPVEIQGLVSSQLVGNFFTSDLALARSTFEKVPWIRHALVQREYPSRLRVVVQEHQPVAYWGTDESVRMVNTDGDLFEGDPEDIQDLQMPVLEGAAEQSVLIWNAYQRLSLVFKSMDNAVIESLQLTPQGRWQADFDNGSSIQLGQGTIADIEARSRKFVATLNQVIALYDRPLESADLRYSNGYAIRLRGVTTVVTAPEAVSIPKNQPPSKPPKKADRKNNG